MSSLLALTFLFAPTYTLRFVLFGFPTNLLMVWVVFVWVIFILQLLARRQWQEFWHYLKTVDKKILILTILFFLSGLVSLFIKGFSQQKLGQFIVLFLQPISLFFITGFTIKQQPKTKSLLLVACYLLLAAMGLYAVIQYFTLLGLPPAWWGNSEEPRRALGFFGHPNFYALFSAPLLAFLIPDVFFNLKSKIFTPLNVAKRQFAFGELFNGVNLKLIAWLLGAIGLLLSMSRAGWLGLAAAFGVYVVVAADKKIRKVILGAAIIAVIVVLVVPNLRWRFILPFYGEKSAVSRLSLWTTGWKGVKESPVTGLGLTGFAKQWPTLNTDPGLASASHNFPHNIFLDLWVETGSFGLISLIGLIGLYIYRGLGSANGDVNSRPVSAETQQNSRAEVGSSTVNCYRLAISLFLIALVVQGLIDNPYFKNDLAMVFWMILSLI